MAKRSLSEIAADINKNWPRMHHGAVPYVDAMRDMTDVTDDYGLESGESIVRRFLSNAGSWRGENARRVKSELCEMLEDQR